MSESRAQLFTVRGTPLVSEGNIHNLLAKAPALWAHVKVYQEGGENGVHAHPREDHLFLVLAGEATFVDAEGRETVTSAYDGMMIPRGTPYAFRSSGSTNLVMVRVGSPADTSDLADQGPAAEAGGGIPTAIAERVGVDGRPAQGLDQANKTGAVAGVTTGRVFGE